MPREPMEGSSAVPGAGSLGVVVQGPGPGELMAPWNLEGLDWLDSYVSHVSNIFQPSTITV